jgi:hypothetical protein
MADIGAAIRSILVADATVATLASKRISSDYLPQGWKLPAIVYFVIDVTPNESLTAIANMSRARMQIDCYGGSRGDANQLSDAVRLALEKNAGVFINEINMAVGPHDGIDRPPSGQDTRRFISSMDYLVSYRVAIS